ncbi:hypothetical protein ACLKA7_004664 [Drosophila subpalustris]
MRALCYFLATCCYGRVSGTNPVDKAIGQRTTTYKHDCREVKASGIEHIVIPSYSDHPFRVYCDAETHDGGWLVILNRIDGSEDFYRNWNAYKTGFGELDGEFWLGLDKIHALTEYSSQELLVILEDSAGEQRYEFYERFAIGSEDEKYVLHTLGKAQGDAGDSLRIHHGMQFSTYDQDNDNWPEVNCAETRTGGWWFNRCHDSDLNGKYDDNRFGKGINWFHFKGWNTSLKKAIMMIRPRE